MAILVRYIGGSNVGTHGGAAGQRIYDFTGHIPVVVENPLDVAEFRRLAKNHPEHWEVMREGNAATLNEAVSSAFKAPRPTNAALKPSIPELLED